MARLSFAGFMDADEVIALLDTELDARHAQIARYRFRDRTLPVPDTPVPFDRTWPSRRRMGTPNGCERP